MIRFISLLVVIIISNGLWSQENISTPEKSSLLWQISGNDIEQPSYIFGTIHLIPKDQYYFPDTLNYLCSHADVIALEIDLGGNFGGAMDKMKLEKDSLLHLFTPAQQDSILAWFSTNMGVSEKAFKKGFGKMKPFVISSMTTLGGSSIPTESYDMNIAHIAKKNSIPIEGLETFDDQLALFDKAPMEVQIEMVMSSIRDDSATENMLSSMVEIYLTQDIEALYDFATQSGDISFDTDAFIHVRNHNWIPKIKALTAKKQAFIAVGAGHLGGPEGVIQLLRKEGYTLIPVEL